MAAYTDEDGKQQPFRLPDSTSSLSSLFGLEAGEQAAQLQRVICGQQTLAQMKINITSVVRSRADHDLCFSFFLFFALVLLFLTLTLLAFLNFLAFLA